MKKINLKMPEIILFICLFLFCVSCVTGKKNDKSPVSGFEPLQHLSASGEAENYLKAKRADTGIYWGDGMANISGDIGKGKIEARKRAINALAEQIKIRVSSDVEMVISKNSSLNGSSYSEEVKKSITQKLETYTNQVLTNLKESRLFIDYPKKGTGTYIVYISKKDYEDKVKKDLNQKKQLITDTIKSGDKEFTDSHYIAGIRLYIQARQMKNSFFGLIPIYHDIDGDGKSEELTIIIAEKIRNFFSRVKLSLLNDSFQYDSEGLAETLPGVYARYIDPNGAKHNVAGLFLKTVFVKGEGEISPVVTGDYGEAELPFTRIDPEFRDVTIRVGVDMDKINGLKEIVTGSQTTLVIKMKRKKTIAYAVSFLNNKKNSVPDSLKETIASLLLDNKYSVIQMPFKTEAEIKKSKNINADYIFLVQAKTRGVGAVGQYANMFTAYCGADLKLYKLPLKTLAYSEQVKSVQGFGVSSESAGWDAFGKITDKIIKKAKKIIETLE